MLVIEVVVLEVVEKEVNDYYTVCTLYIGLFCYVSSNCNYVLHTYFSQDCLRHYEILSAGSIPLFLDIEHCPPGALTWHPKDLYSLLIHQPGLQFYVDLTSQPIGGGRLRVVDNLTFNSSAGSFDQQLYTVITEAMLLYTKNVLSTHSMAAYVLRCMWENSEGYIKNPSPKVLYLTHKWKDLYSFDDMGDFQIDLTLIGLKQILGHTYILYISYTSAYMHTYIHTRLSD